MKVEGPNARKVKKPDFSGKIIFGLNCPKWGIFGPKIDLFMFFSGSAHSFFLLFGMKVEDPNARKVTKPDFSGKIIFGPNCPKWGIFKPKIDLFMFFSKTAH